MTIRKIGPNLWRVFSEESRRNMGTYPSLGLAKRRLGQIEYFKKTRPKFKY